MRDEVVDIVLTTGAEIADRIPENTYWAGAAYTMILPHILNEVGHFMLPQTPLSGPLWNYIDAVCSCFVGLNQLRDDTSHRPIATKIKGALNIFSGVQSIVLTGVNFTVFGGPSFAAAFGIAFSLSLDESVRSARRLSDPEYWLKDNLAQLGKLDLLITRLQKEIDDLKDMPQNKMADWALNRKQTRLQEFMETNKELQEDLLTRMKTLRSQDNLDNNQNHIMIRDLLTKYEKSSRGNFNQWLTESAYKVLELPMYDIKYECSEESHQRKEEMIQTKCKSQLINTVKDSFIIGIAFAGMTLACIPGFQLPAIIVIGVATALYMAKNADKAASFISKSIPPSTDTKIDEEQGKEEAEPSSSGMSP